jgi:Ca2+-binding EF-hand superfamily protein
MNSSSPSISIPRGRSLIHVIKYIYSEFLTVSLDLREMLKSENLQKAFTFIDIDSSNGISANELRKRLGDHIDE